MGEEEEKGRRETQQWRRLVLSVSKFRRPRALEGMTVPSSTMGTTVRPPVADAAGTNSHTPLMPKSARAIHDGDATDPQTWPGYMRVKSIQVAELDNRGL
jgi:hypothetical protein